MKKQNKEEIHREFLSHRELLREARSIFRIMVGFVIVIMIAGLTVIIPYLLGLR